jgi:hypothetical protein
MHERGCNVAIRAPELMHRRTFHRTGGGTVQNSKDV